MPEPGIAPRKVVEQLVQQRILDRLLLETDAPDQPDADHRGQRNEPARLRLVCDTVAELRGIAPEEVAAATTENARRLFGLPGEA